MRFADLHILRKTQIASLGLAICAMPYTITLCHIGVIVFIVAWVLEGDWKNKLNQFRTNKILQLFCLFGVVLLGGMFVTSNKVEGWFKLESLVFFILLPLTLSTLRERFLANETHLFLNLFIFTCLVATVLCLAFAIRNAFIINSAQTDYLITSHFHSLNPDAGDLWLHFSYMALAASIGMNPIYLSLYLIFCILILLNNQPSRPSNFQKWSYLILICYFSLFVIFLSSRLMIFLLLTMLTISVIYHVRTVGLQMKSWAIIGLLLFGLLMLNLNPVSKYKNLQEFQAIDYSIEKNKEYQTSTEIRLSLLWLSWNCFQNVNPVTGTGIGDVEDELSKEAKRQGISNIHDDFNPHNQYAALALGIGIPGLLVFLALLIIPIIRAWQIKDYLLFGFVSVFSLMCITEPALERQKSVILFGLFFPLLAFHRQTVLDYAITINPFRGRS